MFEFNDHKIPVGILGATGSVGQKFIELLEGHPWFEITALAASDRSAGKKYKDAANWFMNKPIPNAIAEMDVQRCQPGMPCKIVFSALDAAVAGDLELEFARAGYIVVSNARNHRFQEDIPLLIPEVNPQHLDVLKEQKYGKGKIVTNPNCSTTGLVLVLKPLMDSFGIEALNVVTMQALSGAGYPGVSSIDALDNVIPFIGGEEEKMEKEPLKILGELRDGRFSEAEFKISASCNRVAVSDGHLESVAIKFKKAFRLESVIEVLRDFRSLPQELNLPMAPRQPIYYFDQEHLPQPKKQRDLDKGMAASVGRLRKCPIFDVKFSVLSHNTVRGAAGGAILNAEIMVAKGYI